MTNAEIAQKLTDATNAYDYEAMLNIFSEDCHFESARLPIVADGAEAVSKAMISWLDLYRDRKLTILNEFYVGDEGFNEWKFNAKNLDGEEIETHGVDYLLFKDGKIAVKNSFRKFLF